MRSLCVMGAEGLCVMGAEGLWVMGAEGLCATGAADAHYKLQQILQMTSHRVKFRGSDHDMSSDVCHCSGRVKSMKAV